MPHTNNTGKINTKLNTRLVAPLLTTVLIVALMATIVAVAAKTYVLSLNLTDARYPNAKIVEAKGITVLNETVYNETVKRLAYWYFTAGKEFRLIIINVTDTYNITKEGSFVLGQPVHIDVTAKANKTGGVTFKVEIPDYMRYYTAYWMIIVTMKAWNREWLVLNFTTAIPMTLNTLLSNLTGSKSILAINSTVFEKLLDVVAERAKIRPNYFIANVSGIGRPYTAPNAVLSVTYYPNGTIVVFAKDHKPIARLYRVTDVARRIYRNVTTVGAIRIKARTYAWRLPYIQAFFLGLGKFGGVGGEAVPLDLKECAKYVVEVRLVTPEGEIEVFSGRYNETFTRDVLRIGGRYYCAFGPIYYVTALFKGIESERKTHDTITYEVVRVKTQSPYSDVYLKINVKRPLELEGKTVTATIVSIIARPKSLINYGVVALITNSTWAVKSKVNVTAVGLYGWIINATKRVLDVAPVLPLPLIEVKINATSLKTLLNETLPYYMAEKLEYKWFVNGKLVGIGKKVTLAGKLEAEVYITDKYTAEVTGGKPRLGLLGKYSLCVWYKHDAVAFVNVTDLISKAVNHSISEVVINGTIPTALVPVVVYLHKLEPSTNVTDAPYLPIELVQGNVTIKVLIERAEVARGKYYSYMEARPMENNSEVVLTPGPFTVFGVRIRPAVLFLPAPEPVKANLTGKIVTVQGERAVVTKRVTLEKPTTVLAVYYYKFDVYYGTVKAGVAIFAIGARVYDKAPPTIARYCLSLVTGEKLCAVIYPVAGNKILYKFNKYVAQYYWNETRKVPINVTLLEPVPRGSTVIWRLTSVTAYACHVAVAVTPLIAYFETLYGKLISDELPSDVSAFVRVIEVTGGEERTVAALSARSVYETFIAIPVKINETGWPVTETAKTALKFVLDYEGYELTAVNRTTGEPLLLRLDKVLAVKVVHVAFPLVRTTLKVVSADKKPLVGFVVEVRSIHTGARLWMAITNDKGEAYIGLLPAGKTVKIIVRTLKPEEDKRWFEESTATNKTLAKTRNNYVEYALWMTGNSSAIVYTLGTRGIADAGVVVNVTLINVPGKTVKELKKIITEDGWVKLPEIRVLNVRPLRVYVVYADADGRYHILKTVMPVYPCGIPGYCAAIIYNTTLVIDDTVYRNASRIIPYRVCTEKGLGPCENYTADFRVIAISWMKPVFERLAEAFEKAAEKAKSEAEKNEENFTAWLEYIKEYYANRTFALTARYLAMYATDKPDAVFTLPLMLGDSMRNMHIARVWLPGQTLHMKVYYMGYEVFNSYVPVPPYNETVIVTPTGNIIYTTKVTVLNGSKPVKVPAGSIVLVASVKPVTFKIVTADTKKPAGKLYLGLVFTDALFKIYGVTANVKVTPAELTWPITMPLNTTTPMILLSTARLKVSVNANLVITNVTTGETESQWKNRTRYIGKVFGVIVPLPVDLSIVVVNGTNKTGKVIERYLLPLATNVSNIYNVTMAIAQNYTEIYVPSGVRGRMIIRVKPLVDLYSIYPVLVYEVNVTPVKKTTLDEKTSAANITWTRSVYKYNISSVVIKFNATNVTKLDKLYVKVYAEYDDKTILLVSKNETALARSLIGRIFSITIAVPRSVIEEKIPKNVSKVKPIVEINATGLEGTLKVRVVITTGAGLVANATNVTLGRFTNGTTMRTEVVVVKPVGPWTRYFGSPMLVLVPVGPSGTVTVLLPEWTESVAGAGARIARIYIIGVNGTPGVVIKTKPLVHVLAAGLVPEVRFYNYTILNLVELPAKVRELNYTLTEKHVAVGDVVYLLGENATSTLIYRFAVTPVEVVDVYKMKSPVVLPAALVTMIKVENKPRTGRGYSVLVERVSVDNLTVGPARATVISAKKTGTVNLTEYMAILATKMVLAHKVEGKLAVHDVCDLLLARTEDVVKLYNPEINVALKYWPPSMTFYEVAGAKVRAIKVEPEWLVQFEKKLADLKENVSETIDLTEHGGIVPELEYSYETLPLKTVFTWSGEETVPYATVAVFNSENASLCEPIAISFTDAGGRLIQPLPVGKRVVVFWYDSYIKFLNTTCRHSASTSASFAALEEKSYLPVVIYDSAISEDVQKLGDARTVSSVRTWTYIAKVVVKDREGRPVPNAIVIVYDALTGGRYYYGVGKTATDGSVVIKDVLLPTATIAPPMPYVVEVYVPIKITNKTVVAVYGGSMRYVLQRGSSEPVQVLPVSTGAAIMTVPVRLVTVVMSAPEGKIIPLAGATVKLEERVPVVELVKLRLHGREIYVKGRAYVETIPFGVKTADEKGEITVSPVYISANGVTTIIVNVLKYGVIDLGYKKEISFTVENATSGPVYVKIPGVKLVAYALSANKIPLGSVATTSIVCTYDGKIIATTTVRGDTASVLFPLPYDVVTGKKTIRCTVSAQAAGANSTTTVTITAKDAKKVVSVRVIVPVSGIVLPGGTFVPMQTLITALVVALIVIIIIVIGLMEYSTWRRKRLVSIIGAPGPAR